MNILVVAPYGMYTNYTGSFVHNQAKAYVQQGHKVRALVPIAIGKCGNGIGRFGPTVEVSVVDGVEVYYVRHLSLGSFGSKFFNARSAAHICKLLRRRLLRDFEPDVIHAHTIIFGGTIGRKLKKRYKIPLIITTHGGDTNAAIEASARAVATRICNEADAVVAVSSACLHRLDVLDFSATRCCILNGFEVQNVVSVPKIPRRVIQVGALSHQKRVALTIQAVAKLKERFSDISLVIVGEGEIRQELEELCRCLGVADCVSFLGQRPNAEVLEEMGKSQIFVMPSVNEGFGIVYLEAMASGCVTVGTRNEGIADLIVHAQNGCLVEPDDVQSIVDTIGACMEDPDTAASWAEQGRRDAMHLTWAYNAEQYVALFQKISPPYNDCR